ncbi:MAG: hypothetical protein EOO43_06465 [Flavobacterium sp.]|nr:MAG: hypothetical protein EOO43_06465 [Flavobacterium sp.]
MAITKQDAKLSFLQSYKELDVKIWDYYADNSLDLLPNPFHNEINSEESHKRFISKYFGKSGKRDVLRDFRDEDVLLGGRAVHTNSVFFFGLLLRENTMIKDRLFRDEVSLMKYPVFPFMWFLSILFHDYAMNIEDEPFRNFNGIKDIDDLMRKYDIQHNLLDEVHIVDHFLPKTIKNYFLYRRFSSKKIDHGVFAGLYLFDRLVKIRRAKEFSHGELSWHKSLEENYAFAAMAIACHNIWTTQTGSPYESDYIKFELNELIIPKFKKISVSNFPLLFLFGIVDTIDPIKIYTRLGHSPSEILSCLDISFTEKSFIISNAVNSNLNFKALHKASENFNGWLAVSITIQDDNLTIEFIDK